MARRKSNKSNKNNQLVVAGSTRASSTNKPAVIRNKVPFQPLRNFDKFVSQKNIYTTSSSKKNRKSRKRIRSDVHPYIYANLDPFALTSIGVKIPDGILAPSIAHFMELDYTQFTDAVFGVSADLYTPDPSAFLYASTGITSVNTWGWAATWVPTSTAAGLPSARGQIQMSRMAAGGISIQAIPSFSNSQGIVYVCYVPMDDTQTGINTVAPTSVSQMEYLPGYQHYPLASLIENELIIPFKRYDDGAYRYRSIMSQWQQGLSTGPESSIGIYGIMVVVAGAALTQNCLYVQQRVHFESQIKPSTGSVFQNTESCAYQPMVMAAASNILASLSVPRAVDDSGIEEQGFVDKVGQAWDTTLKVVSGVTETVGFLSSLAAIVL